MCNGEGQGGRYLGETMVGEDEEEEEQQVEGEMCTEEKITRKGRD